VAETLDEREVGVLEEQFLEHLWPPFTQMQGLKPVIIERGDSRLGSMGG